MVLLAAGCASEQRTMAPAAWYNVRPGMQREQVHELLGTPTQENLGGAEDVYINAVNKTHAELHVQYDAGGTVAAKRYHYVK
jgi:outer membrane protein assembly factor BamE (lipoprotein component of BamABCDE complex)